MAIRFETPDGQLGTLDVAMLATEELGGEVIGVKDGIVQIKKPDGKMSGFSLGIWAAETGNTVVFMEGFNNPDTALQTPPNGMNYIDQATFYNDGADMNALTALYPQAQKNSDGSVVVLDNDGLWKTMWSSDVTPPYHPSTTEEEVALGNMNDPRLTMRTAGVTFLFALAGMEAKSTPKGFAIGDVVKMLKVINRNAPYENKFQIGKLVHQTCGIDPWKFNNALQAPEEVGEWLKRATTMNSFQFRMTQADMAKVMVDGMRKLAQKDFQDGMNTLVKTPEVDNLLVNLKQMFGEFITFLVGLDLLRDISKTTGLNEWISLNESQAYDQSKLPPMPEFVEAFVQLLKWMLPIVKESKLSFARGKTGFKAIVGLMVMIDECIYSLAGVPDSSAKYKMFMALKKLQTQIENKLSFTFQPDPDKNKDGLKENAFMQVKQFYSEKRETVYRLCQTPKEAWNNTLLESLRVHENIEQFYDTLPKPFAELFKSFAAMDAAYDMQPWVDVTHAERTHDPFSQYHESFGLTPPESGYLAKNSPRAVFNMSETLVQGAAFLNMADDAEIKEILRNPWMLANLMKTLMVASVNSEIGAAEVLNKLGLPDTNQSPDPSRIWEDPEIVHAEQQAQLEEIMGQVAMEMASQKQQSDAQNAGMQDMEEMARDPSMAGAGPMGRPQPAMPARR